MGFIALAKQQTTQNSFQPTGKGFIAMAKAVKPIQRSVFEGTKDQLKELKLDPFSLKENPGQALGEAWNSIKDSVINEKEKISALFESKSASEAIGKGLETIAGGAGVLFSPLTAFFEGANNIPVLGSVSKLVTTAFTAVGEAGAGLGGAVVDQLPISQEAKDHVKTGVQEVSALAAQIVAGRAVGKTSKGLSKSKTDMVTKNPELAEDIARIPDTNIDQLVKQYGTEDATTIVKESIKLAKEPKAELGEKGKGFIAQAETKTRGLAKSLEAKAQEAGLVKKIEGLPTYEVSRDLPRIQRALEEVIRKDYEKAKRIVANEEAPPTGLFPNDVLVALQQEATRIKDVETIRYLASDKVTKLSTELGQQIEVLKNLDPESPVAAIREVETIMKETVSRRIKEPSKEVKVIEAKGKEAIKTTMTDKLKDFINSLPDC